MVKLPATVGSAEYGGPVFTNPGGPGGSGVGDILRSGKVYQNMTGNQFDIIGFDPRGVNMTTPGFSAFETAEERLAFFQDQITDVNSTTDALPLARARYQSYGQAAQSSNVSNFMSTADVALDMLAMMNALGQDKLQYYGISYGSYLGQVFATMFPDRVGHIVIDGVIDSEAYLTNDWGTLTQDMDKVMQAFFDSCHSAGPELCPFYASTPSEIAAKLDSIYDSLRAQSLPVVSGGTVAVFTYDKLRASIWGSTTNAFTGFPIIAGTLAQLLQGNVTGVSELREYMSSVNSSFAGVATGFRTECAGWKIHPESRFKGPVGANTSFPILLVGNTADGRTSFEGAKKTNAKFPGSALLTLDAPGHTALIAASSSCISQHVAAYFSNGTLPEEGTVCQPDMQLFGSSPA
ncbi:hypothetical protein VKT23_016012 [Stygiomarasmius scandens]|uniref:Uncharacterized protein n=1 Tax=Marasmiellus scandens TaxID=2682957 RepID=A0ABR1IZC7_9AGAR